MINIVTDKKYLDNDYIMFENSDDFVEAFVTSKDFSELDLFALSEIDGAVLEDKSTDLIKTKFGLTTLSFVSTGCKTVLMYLYYMRNRDKYSGKVVVDINECGWNAIDVLFECADRLNDNSMIFYLCHQNGVHLCKERDYLVNNTRKITNLLYL